MPDDQISPLEAINRRFGLGGENPSTPQASAIPTAGTAGGESALRPNRWWRRWLKSSRSIQRLHQPKNPVTKPSKNSGGSGALKQQNPELYRRTILTIGPKLMQAGVKNPWEIPAADPFAQ